MFILYVGCVSYIYIYTYNSCILFLKDHENITEKNPQTMSLSRRISGITERLREQSSALDWSEGGRLDPVGAMAETPAKEGPKGYTPEV